MNVYNFVIERLFNFFILTLIACFLPKNDFSFLDFFHAELGAGIEDGRFQCSAMASAWSPSFAFEIFGVTVEIGAEVGSVGTAYDRSSSSFSFSISWIFGISIGLDW